MSETFTIEAPPEVTRRGRNTERIALARQHAGEWLKFGPFKSAPATKQFTDAGVEATTRDVAGEHFLYLRSSGEPDVAQAADGHPGELADERFENEPEEAPGEAPVADLPRGPVAPPVPRGW